MTVYRDSVMTRVSLPAIRSMFRPRDFRERTSVDLVAAGVRATVRIVREPSVGAHGGARRWILCPRCQRRTIVVGLVTSAGTSEPAWACARADCGAWRSRKKLRLRRPARGERKDPP
jgi:hypothetical protein